MAQSHLQVASLFIFLFSLSFVLAVGIDNPNLPIVKPDSTGSSYNTTVNNSEYFQGYTPTTLRAWMQTSFDTIYCKLTGCTMTGNLIVNANVTADYYHGDGSYLTGILDGIDNLVPGWIRVSRNLNVTGNIMLNDTIYLGDDDIYLKYNESIKEIELKDKTKTLMNTTMDYINGTLYNITTQYDVKEDNIIMVYDGNNTLTNIVSYKNGILVDNSTLTYDGDGYVSGVIPNA